MQADVTIKSENGGELGNAPNTVYQTSVFDRYGDEADAEIARIIANNAGTGAAPKAHAQPATAASN
jgi:membrane fusion protein (multidrug efflux system)